MLISEVVFHFETKKKILGTKVKAKKNCGKKIATHVVESVVKGSPVRLSKPFRDKMFISPSRRQKSFSKLAAKN